MDIVERLTLEAAQADTMIASEHRQRYALAAAMGTGLRVLDLCCGSGYGSAILATTAREVTGVDNDAATIETARATIAPATANVRFELAEAVDFLSGAITEHFDLVTCFEGLEHLADLPDALGRLREHAEHGVRIIASVPNSKLFAEDNPYHLTQFGYEEAVAAFSDFPQVVLLPQYLAEGSLICPPDAVGNVVSVRAEDRGEIPYANHFIVCVNIDPESLERAHRGQIQVSAAPVFNRWSENLKRTVAALRRENARLARARLGQGGSAAASALATSAEVLDGGGVPIPDPSPAPFTGSVDVLDVTPPAYAPGEDPNTWEQRRRRAAEYLIPWIERTVPLAGKT
ncbi:MAG TPA: class I SAM-dependent methyltransferase, partial [Myxococcaceae bacterium]|nr:class I SAM-dependent methyltransferase [Myxococcaceae bacterium]